MKMVKAGIAILLLVCASPQTKKEARSSEEKRVQEAYEPSKEAKASYIRALSYYQQGKFEDALTYYKEAYEKDPNFIDAAVGMGNCYIALRKFEEAEKVFSALVKKHPEDPRGYEGLGFLYGFCKKGYQKGRLYYLKALEKKPEDMGIIFNLATLSENYDKKEADSLYKVILSKNPNHAGTIKKYLIFLVKEKNFKEALRYAYKAESLFTNDTEVRTKLIEVFYNAKEYTRALEHANFVISRFPNIASLYIERGDIYSALKKYSNALSDYNMALKIEPDNALALLRKADLLVRIGRAYEGINSAKKAINIGFSDVQLKAFAYSIVGDGYKKIAESLSKNSDRDSAIKTYKTAITWYKKTKSLGRTAYYSYADGNVKVCEERIRKLLGIRP
jgi:tetratricopeptide (TPR) repeat protein